VEDTEHLRAALESKEEELRALYRELWPLREAYAAVTAPAALPSRRNRTDKQALIARCPRCGGRIENEV
jgi:PHP family Zn ribbon phosphoesterase